MFLQLGHTKLDAYAVTRQFVKECYVAVTQFPNEEKFILTQQIKRAALSVHLNLAEGSSRKSDTERKRYYEIARGSIIEVDAAFDVASDLGYCSTDSLSTLGEILVKCFKYLSALINSIKIN
ncbi:four helix bundle protein [Mucilaginibacter lappiensis]|uniref:Four helix bundle protein n=1 Tax=Mucilaginibacter lappiensis TaxID=354630 RepID=A0A841JFS6_9SPHI|nr:four helix bundle protein [Mucilaginibacter lappiensis]MBB6129142.1 four helix bundle protein [Mucilaginibacter lappiensis]